MAPADRFCASCGTPQPQAGATPGSSSATAGAAADPMRNLSPHTASVLCYVPIVGWIMSVIVLAAPQFAKERAVRFHAFQGIYLFVAWLLVQWVLEPMFGWMPYPTSRMFRLMTRVMEFSVFFAWIWMLVKTSQHQFFSLPVIGELADRSVAEQR